MSFIKPYKEDEDKFIYFKISIENTPKFLLHLSEFHESLDNKELVPAEKVLEFTCLFENLDDDKEKHYKRIINNLIKRITLYFEQNKDYLFLTTPLLKSYHSKTIIEHVISVAVHIAFEEKAKTENKKKEFISSCYGNIISYIYQAKEFSKKITHYRATVVSGYTAMQFGFELSKELRQTIAEGIRPTNQQIFLATRYYTDPLNPMNKKQK